MTGMLPVQCKMSRAALGWGMRELAAKAKVSVETVVRFEHGAQLGERTLEALSKALERAGVVFLPENGRGVGVWLKRKPKRRASSGATWGR